MSAALRTLLDFTLNIRSVRSVLEHFLRLCSVSTRSTLAFALLRLLERLRLANRLRYSG